MAWSRKGNFFLLEGEGVLVFGHPGEFPELNGRGTRHWRLRPRLHLAMPTITENGAGKVTAALIRCKAAGKGKESRRGRQIVRSDLERPTFVARYLNNMTLNQYISIGRELALETAASCVDLEPALARLVVLKRFRPPWF